MADAEGPIPVIDVSCFLAGAEAGDEAKRAVAAQVDRACREVGFLMVSGHGVPEEVVDDALNATRELFDLPLDDKMQATMTHDYPHGYTPIGGENLSKGKSAEEASAAVALRPDMKECFSIGTSNPAAGQAPRRFPPGADAVAAAYETYYSAMEGVAQTLLRSFALALDLEENWFEDKIDRHLSALRTLNYPHLDIELPPGQFRASPHTDYGALTVLAARDRGLEVQRRDGRWVEVQYVPGTFVVNLGDLMSRWTNDRWVSTPHRVMAHPPEPGVDSRRLSMAFFFNINGDYVVQCIPSCTDESNPPKYEPIGAMDFLMMKHRAATQGTAEA